MSWDGRVPFNEQGLVTYPGYGNEPAEWLARFELADATVEYEGIQRGCSALRVKWRVVRCLDPDSAWLVGKLIYTGFSTLDAAVRAGETPRYTDTFTFHKRGANYLAQGKRVDG